MILLSTLDNVNITSSVIVDLCDTKYTRQSTRYTFIFYHLNPVKGSQTEGPA